MYVRVSYILFKLCMTERSEWAKRERGRARRLSLLRPAMSTRSAEPARFSCTTPDSWLTASSGPRSPPWTRLAAVAALPLPLTMKRTLYRSALIILCYPDNSTQAIHR